MPVGQHDLQGELSITFVPVRRRLPLEVSRMTGPSVLQMFRIQNSRRCGSHLTLYSSPNCCLLGCLPGAFTIVLSPRPSTSALQRTESLTRMSRLGSDERLYRPRARYRRPIQEGRLPRDRLVSWTGVGWHDAIRGYARRDGYWHPLETRRGCRTWQHGVGRKSVKQS